jgi:hypothetical protein
MRRLILGLIISRRISGLEEGVMRRLCEIYLGNGVWVLLFKGCSRQFASVLACSVVRSLSFEEIHDDN